jgi:hypothetical protein
MARGVTIKGKARRNTITPCGNDYRFKSLNENFMNHASSTAACRKPKLSIPAQATLFVSFESVFKNNHFAIALAVSST